MSSATKAGKLLDRIETHLQRWLADIREQAEELRHSVMLVRELRLPWDAPLGPDAVAVCAWCPELHILRIERGAADVVVYYQRGNELQIFRNEKRLEITHGMCPACDLRMRAGQKGEG